MKYQAEEVMLSSLQFQFACLEVIGTFQNNDLYCIKKKKVLCAIKSEGKRFSLVIWIRNAKGLNYGNNKE